MIPVLPRYIRGPLGSGDVAVGVLVGAVQATGFLVRPWLGHVIDRRGARPILVLGLVAAALSGCAYPLATSTGLLLPPRILLGVAEAAVFTAGSVWTLALAPAERRGQVLGLFGLSVWTSLTVAPPMGELLRTQIGYGAVWLGAAIAPLLGLAVLLRLPAPAHDAAAGQGGPLVPRGALLPGAGLACGAVASAALTAFLVLQADAEHVAHGSLAIAAYAAATAAVRILLGRLPDRLGPRRTLLVAVACGASGQALIAASSSLAPLLVGGALFGACWGLLYPSLALLVLERIDTGQRGRALAAYGAFWDLGFGLGAPALGVIAANAGYRAVFVAATVAIAGAALVVPISRRRAAMAS